MGFKVGLVATAFILIPLISLIILLSFLYFKFMVIFLIIAGLLEFFYSVRHRRTHLSEDINVLKHGFDNPEDISLVEYNIPMLRKVECFAHFVQVREYLEPQDTSKHLIRVITVQKQLEK